MDFTVHSTSVFDQIRRWLDICESSHGGFCRFGNVAAHASAHFDVPTRLLEITREHDGSLSLRLVISRKIPLHEQEANEAPRWVTLSYCWGEFTNFFTTTRKNYHQHLERIEFDELPNTFRHAIIIADKLDLKYVWIDALCIIQPSDGDTTDWDIEAGRMRDVYRGATVTISAASAVDVSKGIFWDRPALRYPIKPCRLSDLCGRGFDLPPGEAEEPMMKWRVPLWQTNVELASVTKRGWILQERMLSRRIIYCTSQSVFWECADLRASEYEPDGCGQTRYAAQHLKDVMLTANSGRDWWKLVEDYSARRLTARSDKLPALSGIAQAFHEIRPDKYLSGLWQQDLPETLGWWTPIHPYMYESNSYRFSRAPDLPSWSWASVDTPVDLNTLYNVSNLEFGERGEFDLAVVDSTITLAGPDPFGKVQGGCLQIRGRLQSFDLSSVDQKQIMKDPVLMNWVMVTKDVDLYVDELDWLSDVDFMRHELPCVCLYRTSPKNKSAREYSVWIALKAAPDRGASSYSRIGLLTQEKKPGSTGSFERGEIVDIELT